MTARESCICNEGNPLFARESKGIPPTGLISNIVDYLHVIPGGTPGNSCWGCATRNPFSDQKGRFSFTPFLGPGLLNPLLFSELASKKLDRHYLD